MCAKPTSDDDDEIYMKNNRLLDSVRKGPQWGSALSSLVYSIVLIYKVNSSRPSQTFLLLLLLKIVHRIMNVAHLFEFYGARNWYINLCGTSVVAWPSSSSSFTIYMKYADRRLIAFSFVWFAFFPSQQWGFDLEMIVLLFQYRRTDVICRIGAIDQPLKE